MNNDETQKQKIGFFLSTELHIDERDVKKIYECKYGNERKKKQTF